jgi:MFS family permease
VGPLPAFLGFLVLAHIAYVGGRLTYVLYALELGASPGVVGLMIGALSLIPAFSSIHAGRWVDRAGSRLPCSVGALGLAFALLVACLTPSIAALFVASLLHGALFNIFNVSSQTLVSRGAVAGRVARNSAYSIADGIATVCAPLAAGYAIDAWGHLGALLALAALALVAAVAVGLPALHPPHSAAAPREPGQRRAADLLASPDLLWAFLVALMMTVTWEASQLLLPVFGRSIGLSAAQIGIVVGSFMAASLVVRLLLPLAHRRFTTWQLVLLAHLATALPFFLFAVSSSYATLIAVAWLFGVGIGVLVPLSLTLIGNAAPPARIAEALGMRTVFIRVTALILPTAMGSAATAFGVAPIFIAGGLLNLGASWAFRNKWRAPSVKRETGETAR